MYRYKSYDTHLKAMYHLGVYIPAELDQLIPSSNKSRWKEQDPTKHIGSEWCQTIEKHGEHLNLALENQQTQRSILVLLKVNVFLIRQFIQSGHHFKVMKENIESVIDFVSYLKQYITTEKATKLLGLKRGTFQSYLHQVKYKCFDSPILFCYKANPLQLSFNELQKIKQLMTDDRFKYWSAISIYYYGLRNKTFQFSKSTFYYYTHLLGLTRRWVKKTQRKEGLRANRPNEYWHADVSIWNSEGIRYYIYVVIDNYSRKVLSWKVNKKISAKLMFANLNEAYQKFTPKNTIRLIVDGGSENQIRDKLDLHQLPIDQLRAQVDIKFSNSMVEATFQTIKKYYFRTILKEQNKIDPNKELPWIIEDINANRPNAQLNGLTPNEAYAMKYSNIPKNDFTKAKKIRRIDNLNYSCIACNSFNYIIQE